MIINKMASSVDPDEMAHYESSYLNLHCLYRYLHQFTVLKSVCISILLIADYILFVFISLTSSLLSQSRLVIVKIDGSTCTDVDIAVDKH